MIANIFLIERRDNKNNWQLIETSENVYQKFSKIGMNTREQIYAYFNHPIINIKNVMYKNLEPVYIMSYDQNLDNFYAKLDDYNISPLSKCYIEKIIDSLESVEFQSFDKISNYLIGKHKEIFLDSIPEVLACSITHDLYVETHKVASIFDITSNHQYLDIIESKFLSNDLENFRIIFLS